jgi:hypothetical protein
MNLCKLMVWMYIKRRPLGPGLIFVDQKHPNIFVSKVLNTLKELPTDVPDLILNGTLRPMIFKIQPRNLPFHWSIGLWSGLLSSIYPVVAVAIGLYCFCKFKNQCRNIPKVRTPGPQARFHQGTEATVELVLQGPQLGPPRSLPSDAELTGNT